MFMAILFVICGFFVLCLLIYFLLKNNRKGTPIQQNMKIYWFKTYCAAFLVVVFFILYICGYYADPTITVFGAGFRASVFLFFYIWGLDYLNASHKKEKNSELVRILKDVYAYKIYNTIVIALICFFLMIFLSFAFLFFWVQVLK